MEGALSDGSSVECVDNRVEDDGIGDESVEAGGNSVEDDGIGGESVEAGGNSVEDDGIGGECMEAIVVDDGNVGESMEAGRNTVGDARSSNVGDVNGNGKSENQVQARGSQRRHQEKLKEPTNPKVKIPA